MMEELQLLQEFEKNDIWFRNNYQNLQKKYVNEFIAIKDRKVIDHDRNPKILIKRLEEKRKNLILILIQFIPEKGLQILY